MALASGSLVEAQPKSGTIDHAALAEKLVGGSANVKEGDIVELRGGAADLPLLEELVIAVRKRGAHPLLSIGSEKVAKAFNTTIADKYDAQAPKLELELAKLINVRITIPAVRDPSIGTLLSADRQAKREKAGQPVRELILKRNVRTVELDNGFAPSPWRAKELGI
ncbi:MAG: aminopeptidase, partial [Deltaproteobacteria bacterium]|nr:aminopeptidase [Deltaproteobacteria bacterium]